MLFCCFYAARPVYGVVDDFGVFLTEMGLPFGSYVAWAITVFEIAGSVLLAAGLLVAAVSLLFAVELITGVFPVHLPEGWFVVGAGRNGGEYSILLIAVLLALAFAGYERSEK